MRIKKEDVLLLLIDVQERLFPHIHQSVTLEHKLIQLIEGMKILDVPILVSEQYTKGLGSTISSIQKVISDTPTECKFIEKITFSCAQNAEIAAEIEHSGKRTIILAGIEAHICVLQTALDLAREGYDVVVVADAISSRFAENKEIALLRLDKHTTLTTVESLLFELCQVAGTAQFKAISQLVK